MRLLTFVDPPTGTLHVGALSRDAARVVDLTVIGLDDMFMAVERAANLARIADHLVESEGAVGYPTGDVRIVAPMPGARCIHGMPAAVAAGAAVATVRALPVADAAPALHFADPAPLLGPGDALTVRAGDQWTLAVACVLARGGRDVPAEHALDLVAGYAIAGRWLGESDADTRVVQLGPWLLTRDAAGEPGTARGARLLRDGAIVASGEWRVGAPFGPMIAAASARYELRPGDVLTAPLPCAATLVAGQSVRLEVDGLGALVATAV